jgi:hypothetical protein
MIWLEKHIIGFFRFTGIFLILVTIFYTWGIIFLGGIPHGLPSVWTPYQWDMLKFLWIPTLWYLIIYLLLAALCFMKKYFAFPVSIVAMWYGFGGMSTPMLNLVLIVRDGFIYPVANLLGIIALITFVLSLIGTLLWINRLKNNYIARFLR